MACVDSDSDLPFQELVLAAGEFVLIMQRVQGLPIAIVEEIAFWEQLNRVRPAHGGR